MVSGWQVTFAIFSPIIGNFLARFGRKNALVVAVIVEIIVAFISGLLYYVEDVHSFWWLNFGVRMVEGIAEAIVVTTVSAIIGIEFKEEIDVHMSYM